MQIAIDASRVSVAERTGTERYSYELLAALARLDRHRDYTLYTNGLPASLPPLGPNFRLRSLPLDLSAGLQKSFRLTERFGLETRMEAFNLLNRVNYETYSGNLLDPRFGQATSAFPARQIQIMFHLKF